MQMGLEGQFTKINILKEMNKFLKNNDSSLR